MSALDDILKEVPISQLASQVGASKSDTKTAVTHAVTSLLGGMSANAADGGEEALLKAAKDHANDPLDITQVDPVDGAKIVKHVLGTTPEAAAHAVAGKTGANADLLAKLMPILAPMVMAYLGSKISGGSAAKTAMAGGLGGIIGNLFGGATQQESPGGVLGGLFGGGAQQENAGGGLGGLLGGATQAVENAGGGLGGLLGGGAEPAGAGAGGGIGDLLGGLLGNKVQPGNSAAKSGGLGGLLDSIF